MLPAYVHYKGRTYESIEVAVHEMAQLAASSHKKVWTSFNGVIIVVDPKKLADADYINEVVGEFYYQHFNRTQKAGERMKTRQDRESSRLNNHLRALEHVKKADLRRQVEWLLKLEAYWTYHAGYLLKEVAADLEALQWHVSQANQQTSTSPEVIARQAIAKLLQGFRQSNFEKVYAARNALLKWQRLFAK